MLSHNWEIFYSLMFTEALGPPVSEAFILCFVKLEMKTWQDIRLTWSRTASPYLPVHLCSLTDQWTGLLFSFSNKIRCGEQGSNSEFGRRQSVCLAFSAFRSCPTPKLAVNGSADGFPPRPGPTSPLYWACVLAPLNWGLFLILVVSRTPR